jgi:hypothetical protein
MQNNQNLEKLDQNLEKFFSNKKKLKVVKVLLFLSLRKTQRIINYKVFSFSKKI